MNAYDESINVAIEFVNNFLIYLFFVNHDINTCLSVPPKLNAMQLNKLRENITRVLLLKAAFYQVLSHIHYTERQDFTLPQCSGVKWRCGNAIKPHYNSSELTPVCIELPEIYVNMASRFP